MYLLGVAIENEQGDIRLTVLKSGAGGMEYIKFRCNLLVSLARILFLNWLYMNESDYFEIN